MTPLVLIPGLLCTAELFAPQIAHLWPERPVMVAWTLGGDSIAAIASDILANAPPRFALGGISMGGYIALEILRQAPGRIERLALIDTSARPDTPQQTQARHDFLQAAQRDGLETCLRRGANGFLHPRHQNDLHLTGTIVRMGLDIGPEGMARQMRAVMARIDSRPHLAAIAVPTCVLVGEEDHITPPACARELAAGIPGARLTVIENAGHASTLEQPQAVSGALRAWLHAS